MEHQSLPTLVTVCDLVAALHLSRTTIYRLRKKGTFPEPIQFASGHIRWRSTEILAWLDALPQKFGSSTTALDSDGPTV